MRMKRFVVVAVTLTLIAMVGLIEGCANLNQLKTPPPGYAEASHTFRLDAAAYAAAVKSLHSNIVTMTPDQRHRFSVDQKAGVDAANGVEYSLRSWGLTGIKPPDFDSVYAAYVSAVAKITDLDIEVQPKKAGKP